MTETNKRRTEFHQVRLSPEEKKDLNETANRNGRDASEFIRDAVQYFKQRNIIMPKDKR